MRNSNTPERYNLLPYEAEFKLYCSAVIQVSPQSLKGYVSDYRYFAQWLAAHFPDTSVESATQSMLLHYRDYLDGNFPRSSTNRRLSSIRAFYSFLISQGILTESPMREIHNIAAGMTTHSPHKALVDDFMSAMSSLGVDERKRTANAVNEFLSISSQSHESSTSRI